MFSRGPVSQRAQKEKRVDYERKDREIKKLRFEMEKVSSFECERVRWRCEGVCVNVREG